MKAALGPTDFAIANSADHGCRQALRRGDTASATGHIAMLRSMGESAGTFLRRAEDALAAALGQKAFADHCPACWNRKSEVSAGWHARAVCDVCGGDGEVSAAARAAYTARCQAAGDALRAGGSLPYTIGMGGGTVRLNHGAVAARDALRAAGGAAKTNPLYLSAAERLIGASWDALGIYVGATFRGPLVLTLRGVERQA